MPMEIGHVSHNFTQNHPAVNIQYIRKVPEGTKDQDQAADDKQEKTMRTHTRYRNARFT